MPEMTQKQDQQGDLKNEAMGPPKVSGLGALLRNEREKRGLSYEQVAQITRLRRHFVEAIENEEWNNLPPSVFVKGFIKSYAKALGLDEGKLIDLYRGAVPDDVAPPTPIIEPKKPRKGMVFLFVVLLLGISAATLYLWPGKPSREQAPVQTEKELATETQREPIKEAQPTVKKGKKEDLAKDQKVATELPKPSVGPAEMDIPGPLPEEKKQEVYPTDKDLFTASTTDVSGTADWRVLTGTVHLRTWIRIYIDDEAPKEYILQPGSRPQWKARRGFYVLVGNAAGMDFDFDGKEIKDLGELGKVVSLRLPEDFDREISEE